MTFAMVHFTSQVDAVPTFKSSPVHILLLQVTMNELPPKLRAKHIILGGLLFGPTCPEINYFLQPFVDECLLLENKGLTCQLNGTATKIPVYNLLCITDSVVHCKVQNIKQFNGEHGCNWCYHKGEVVEKGNGYTRVSPSEWARSTHRQKTQHRGWRGSTIQKHYTWCEGPISLNGTHIF